MVNGHVVCVCHQRNATNSNEPSTNMKQRTLEKIDLKRAKKDSPPCNATASPLRSLLSFCLSSERFFSSRQVLLSYDSLFYISAGLTSLLSLLNLHSAQLKSTSSITRGPDLIIIFIHTVVWLCHDSSSSWPYKSVRSIRSLHQSSTTATLSSSNALPSNNPNNQHHQSTSTWLNRRTAWKK